MSPHKTLDLFLDPNYLTLRFYIGETLDGNIKLLHSFYKKQKEKKKTLLSIRVPDKIRNINFIRQYLRFSSPNSIFEHMASVMRKGTFGHMQKV